MAAPTKPWRRIFGNVLTHSIPEWVRETAHRFGEFPATL
jgi:hypothetical protein